MKSMRHLLPAAVLLATLAACAPADDAEVDDIAADTTAATTTAPPAAPAELQARNQQFAAGWNQEDVAMMTEFFSESATVVDDTMTFNGRAEIQQWLTESLPVISALAVQDETLQASGQDYVAAGRFTLNGTSPEGDFQAAGRYESTWALDTDGVWRVRSMNIVPDPETTTAQ